MVKSKDYIKENCCRICASRLHKQGNRFKCFCCGYVSKDTPLEIKEGDNVSSD